MKALAKRISQNTFLKLLMFITILLSFNSTAFSIDLFFNEKTLRSWEVLNYGKKINLQIVHDDTSKSTHLEITLDRNYYQEVKRKKRVDTRIRLISPKIMILPKKAYSLIIRKAITFDIRFVKPNKKLNNIIWYNIYNEKIGKPRFMEY